MDRRYRYRKSYSPLLKGQIRSWAMEKERSKWRAILSLLQRKCSRLVGVSSTTGLLRQGWRVVQR